MKLSKIVLTASILLAAAVAPLSAQPIIATGGVIDGASFSKGLPVAPGSIVSIFGSNLSSALQAGDTVPLSTSLNNVSVTFNGIPAGLDFVSSGQINAQLPWNVLASGATSGSATAVVTSNGVASAPVQVPINAWAPGIFSTVGGYAIAINPDGSLAAPSGAIPGLATRPAKIGDALIILGNGFGPVDSPISNGAASLDKLRNTTSAPTVLIGGQPAQVFFSGLTPQFPGINQLNIAVPNVTAGGSVSLQVQIGGVTSATGVIIAVGN
jgi:uncharacterized protein (TIGR03437 family)